MLFFPFFSLCTNAIYESAGGCRDVIFFCGRGFPFPLFRQQSVAFPVDVARLFFFSSLSGSIYLYCLFFQSYKSYLASFPFPVATVLLCAPSPPFFFRSWMPSFVTFFFFFPFTFPWAKSSNSLFSIALFPRCGEFVFFSSEEAGASSLRNPPSRRRRGFLSPVVGQTLLLFFLAGPPC